MSIDRKYPMNADPRMKSILEAIYGAIDELQRRPSSIALSAEDRLAISRQAASQAVGLLGPFGVPVLGQGSDPLLTNVGTGNGTVFSFTAGDLSPLFTTAEANPTTNPVLTFAQIAQNANRIFAGPSSGVAGNPSFRALVADDLPTANLNIAEIIASQTLTDADDGFWVNAVGGAVDVTLTPAATALIKPYYFKKIDASANAMTVKVDGGTADMLDGGTSVTTIVAFTSFTLIPDPTGFWWLV